MGELGPSGLAVLAVACLVGGTVQGSIGFGFALTVAPVFGLIDASSMPGAVLLLGVPLNLAVWIRERSNVDVEALRWVLVGVAVGTPFGAAVLVLVPASLLGVAFGGAIIVAAMASIAHPPDARGAWMNAAAGAASGLINTVAGIGGPVLAVLYQRRPPEVFRALLAVAFLFSTVLSIIAVGVAGRIDRDTAVTALALVPPLGLGIALSGLFAGRIRATALRPVIFLAATAAGSAAIVRAL